MTNEPDRNRIGASARADMFLGLVRIYLGVGLIFKSVYFMTNQEYLMQLMSGVGSLWIAPATLLHYVIPAHLIGGLLLTFGLLTRVAALIQLPVMLGAVFWIYLPNMAQVEPRQNLEFAALVMFLLALICAFGSGRWALDNKLSRPRLTAHKAAHAGA